MTTWWLWRLLGFSLRSLHEADHAGLLFLGGLLPLGEGDGGVFALPLGSDDGNLLFGRQFSVLTGDGGRDGNVATLPVIIEREAEQVVIGEVGGRFRGETGGSHLA